MKTDKLKKIDIRYFLFPFFALTLVFLTLIYFVASNRIKERYDDFEREAIGMADVYSNSLVSSHEAYEIISDLLNEKLMIASQAIMLIEDNKDSEALSNLAERFQIDEIHLYNKDGVIVYSKGNKYVGWEAYEGHPVYDFMISNQELLVEEIRRDTESHVYYKYAYVKNEDGTFVQIGVLADNIQRFLGRFDLQVLINGLSQKDDLIHVSFINNEYEIIASSNTHYIGRMISDESERLRIANDHLHTLRRELDSQDVFQVCVPVFYGNKRFGTLSVAYSTDRTDNEIRNIIFEGIIQFHIVFLVLGSILFYAYRKNKSNIRIAYYDKLTGLPNNEYLQEYLQDKINNIGNKNMAIFLLSCTNFRTLNMTYGFIYGNEILKQITKEVQNIIKSSDKLFRFGADRLVIVVNNYIDRNDLKELASNIIDAFKEPFVGNREHQYVNAKISIVEMNKKNVTVDTLLQDATLALTHVNKSLYENICFFEEVMEDIVIRQDRIEKKLWNIIKDENDDSLYLHFQPKWDVKRGKITGFEALARLSLEGLGNVSPIEFIEIAEKRLIIYELGRKILLKACEFIKKINSSNSQNISVSVNISGLQLLRDEFIEDLTDIVKTLGIDSKLLEFEITESVLLDNFDLINKKLEEIKKMDISISLDDFGTGFSSFSRLRDLNIDIVKIDKYFIDKIDHGNEDDMICADIISISHKLGLTVVAEGVEEAHQMKYLEANGCDIIQGYYISKPICQADAVRFLNA
ncbi:MAG: bifunctional diguanylate cyclase/phosphodiesterase [Anaerolineaceae bacterium]|nr:MAG: bifunctional diguanylate cyclase/phosphodiesterase [Anaerolineaceae bacterium]